MAYTESKEDILDSETDQDGSVTSSEPKQSHIRVFCRLRPLPESCSQSVCYSTQKKKTFSLTQQFFLSFMSIACDQ